MLAFVALFAFDHFVNDAHLLVDRFLEHRNQQHPEHNRFLQAAIRRRQLIELCGKVAGQSNDDGS